MRLNFSFRSKDMANEVTINSHPSLEISTRTFALKQPQIEVTAKIQEENGRFSPKINLSEEELDENSAMVYSMALSSAFEQTKELSDKINQFISNTHSYLQAIDDALKNKKKEDLFLYLALRPDAFPDKDAYKVAASILKSGILGDLTQESHVGRLDSTALKSLILFAEKTGSTLIPDEMPLTGIAEFMERSTLFVKNDRSKKNLLSSTFGF